MKIMHWLGIGVFSAGIGCISALAQAPLGSQDPATPSVTANPPASPEPGAVVLDWTPPALTLLSAQAAARSSFTLDRTMLAGASSLLPDSDQEARQAIAKIDGISVHQLHFGAGGIADLAQVEAVREAYRQHGWKHLVTTTRAGSPIHSGTTDLWLTLDGVNVRGAVVLVETPKSLTLVTLKGDLSPLDLLHLRGHFGIPRFDADGFKDAKDR
jgi:hypothetical protein